VSNEFSSKISRRAFVSGAGCALTLALGTAPFVQAATNDSSINTANPYTDQYGMPNCTWYCAQCVIDDKGIYIQQKPNAKDWGSFAGNPNAFGFAFSNSYIPASIYPCKNTNPMRGDIAVFPDPVQHWANTDSDGSFTGHVAYCESGLDSQGMFWVSEQNYKDHNTYPNTSPYKRPYPYVRFRQINLAAMRQAEPDATFIRFDHQTSVGPSIQAGMVFTTSRSTTVINNNGNTLAQLGRGWNVVVLSRPTVISSNLSVLCAYPDAHNGYDYASEAQVASRSGPIGYIALSVLAPCTKLRSSAPRGQTNCTWRDWTPDQHSDQIVSTGSSIVLASWDSQLWAWWWGNWNNQGVWSCRWVHANDTSGRLQDNQKNSRPGREIGTYLRDWQAF